VDKLSTCRKFPKYPFYVECFKIAQLYKALRKRYDFHMKLKIDVYEDKDVWRWRWRDGASSDNSFKNALETVEAVLDLFPAYSIDLSLQIEQGE